MICALIWKSTVFVDYFTKFIYVSLMTDQTAKSTVKAKHHFENFAGTCSVSIDPYHADNGVLWDCLFMEEIKQ